MFEWPLQFDSRPYPDGQYGLSDSCACFSDHKFDSCPYCDGHWGLTDVGVAIMVFIDSRHLSAPLCGNGHRSFSESHHLSSVSVFESTKV